MTELRSLRDRFWRLIGNRLSTSSLQFRLTLELTLLSVLGIGTVAWWAGWYMNRTLISANKQNLDYVVMRFVEQLEMYSEMESLSEGLEKTIQKASAPQLLVWVQDTRGKLLARSSPFDLPSAAIADALSLQNIPSKTMVTQVSGRTWLLCSSPFVLRGQPAGEIYFARDMTYSQQQLNRGKKGLVAVSLMAIAVLSGVLYRRIDRALQPLAEMSEAARAISADDIATAKLELQQAPDEILGLAMSFNAMLMNLSKAWDQQRQFVGNVSHELRTPLTVIAGYLQSLLRRGTNLNDYQQQAIATAAAETDRTIRMLQDLLDLARADSGHLHFRQTPVYLRSLLLEVAEMAQKVSNRPIAFITRTGDIVAVADPDRLQQVLINLVDNAIKYSPAGRPVELILEKSADFAAIHVRDRGMGIALEHQSRLFERFYRVDEAMTRSRDGTGLGLAIAKSLIEGMGGRIGLRSKPGEGSVFTVTLPLWKKIP